MSDKAAVTRELAALEKAQAEIAAITSRDDDGRRLDLVQARRRLSEQVARLGEVADLVFQACPDAEIARAYRAKFSGLRSMMAMHQANWPAVMLGERPAEFRASALRLREANREFVQWVRDALTRV